ncbi:brefeldin A-inhibited guanine nucleotide-exchange protein 3-like [Pollicipes pollicipes]|uniref:brefeldin A-inhibited guanine nucleotide-exchange protein 3-like n=1 Tax=Pollicipes pollicipes TaxID=41117 RepID=UPI0018856B78|nr:brefeldin A-inhibited guanine nucleotide-exchange protein 3-like [Pollicipes pollicipes]
MEAACHKELAVSKKAVCCIHDTVNAMLSSHSELPHFHVNEALFKPLETLLCLELCDADVQDQIVGSICEFVELSTAEIRSGWRPLFGALRSPPPAAEPRHAHLRVVLDVFEAFLNTDNVLVFANAAVDCILCLLKHVRGPTELQDNNSSLQDQEQVVPLDTLGGTQLDLCRAALRYISRCHAILASMHGMHSCPVFHAAHRIQLNTAPLTVDPAPDDESAPPEEPPTSPADGPPVTYERLAVQGPFTALEQLDNASGILRVWYLLLEGLAGATATCPRRHQPQTMETLFTLLRSLANRPGAEFGIYCVNHLLLPMVQGWLRRTGRRHRGWDAFATNFKQCCGLATDLVVFYHKTLPADASERQRAGAQLMMRQLLLVMIECVCQPHEVISRLGCACISRQSAASSLPTACRSVGGTPLSCW